MSEFDIVNVQSSDVSEVKVDRVRALNSDHWWLTCGDIQPLHTKVCQVSNDNCRRVCPTSIDSVCTWQEVEGCVGGKKVAVSIEILSNCVTGVSSRGTGLVLLCCDIEVLPRLLGTRDSYK